MDKGRKIRKEKGEQIGGERGESERRERNKKVDLLDISTVESRWSKSKSQSTHRGLRVGTKILEFRQTL